MGRLGNHTIPSLLVNDIRAALAQEAAVLSRSATAAVVVCGTAVGSAYLSEGRVVRGARGWAGEIGSLPMTTPLGVRRLDELAGGSAIVRAAGMPPRSIHTALAEKDRRVQAVVHAAGEAFGLALASLVNFLNPEVVRVAGGTLGYQGYWDAALSAAKEKPSLNSGTPAPSSGSRTRTGRRPRRHPAGDRDG